MTSRSIFESETGPATLALTGAGRNVESVVLFRDATETSRTAFAYVMAASLAAHVAIAARVITAHSPPRSVISEVEVVVTRPPPPPPPPAEVHPPPPQPAAAPLAHQAVVRPIAVHEPQPVPGTAVPAGDDGDVPIVPAPPAPIVAAAPPAPPPPPPPPVIAAREGANYLHNPRPAYPRIAQREGWEGVVLLHVRVEPDGHAGTIGLQKSSGRDVLDAAAVQAVRSWSFVPATQGGVPIAGWVTVPIEFRLQ